jgi:hypothetical protein
MSQKRIQQVERRIDRIKRALLVSAIIRKRSFLNYEPRQATSSAPKARIIRPIISTTG